MKLPKFNISKISGFALLKLLVLTVSLHLIDFAKINSESAQISIKTIAEETYLTLESDLDSNKSFKELSQNIESILANKNLKNSNYGLAIYSLDQEKYVYLKNSNSLLTPASTTKLVTSFMTLVSHGGDFPVRTQVFSDSKPDKNGVVNGNVYLVGHGDAILSTKDIYYLADQIKNTGIKKITGNIIADGSFFDGITSRQAYSGDLDEVQGLAPITALGIEKNQVTVNVSARRAGEAADLEFIPETEAFIKTNLSKVSYPKSKKSNSKSSIKSKSKSNSKSKAKKSRKRLAENSFKNSDNQYFQNYSNYVLKYDEAEQIWGDGKGKRKLSSISALLSTSLSVSTAILKDGKQQFVVKGNVSLGNASSYRYIIKNPELAATGAFMKKLKWNGIVIGGNLVSGSIKPYQSQNKAYLLAEFSRSIFDLLKPLNKFSDNYIAEHLFKINGATNSNYENNSQGACDLIARVADSLNIPFKSCKLNDGSGLSRRNKLTPEALTDILVLSKKMPFGAKYDSTFAIAGVDGTLRNRMIGTYAQNNLHAKTGTLRNVSGLSGFVTSKSGEKFAFAFLFNGPNVGFYKHTEDQIGIALSKFTYLKKDLSKLE